MAVQLRAVAAGAMPGRIGQIFAGPTCRRFTRLMWREQSHRRIRGADRSPACDAAKYSSRLFFAYGKCETPPEAARRGERNQRGRSDEAEPQRRRSCNARARNSDLRRSLSRWSYDDSQGRESKSKSQTTDSCNCFSRLTNSSG